MKFKKMLTIGSLFATTLLVAACGNGSDDSSSASSSSETTAKTTTSSESKTSVDLNSLDLPQLDTEIKANESAVEMVTTKGTIKIKLFPEIAPKTVENFITHAKDGYYNGVTFHRVINDFMIQSGDPEGTGAGGESIWGESFEDEFSDQLYNIRGALSMANAGANTNGSQFFIVQSTQDMSGSIDASDYPEKIVEAYKNGGTPWLDGAHTVFGQVIEGMDVVDAIAAVEVDDADKPKEEIKIESINVIQEAE